MAQEYKVIETYQFTVKIGTGTVTKAFDKKTGAADPYVRIGKVNRPNWLFKSQVCRDTLSPEWNETGTFETHRVDYGDINLVVEMRDYDPGLLNLDDLIGRAEIDGTELFKGSLELKAKDGNVYGTINDITISGKSVKTMKIPLGDGNEDGDWDIY